MENRKEDDLEWFVVNNHTVSPPPPPPQETHQFGSPASFVSPENPLRRDPTLPENYAFRFSQPEFNPYHPITMPRNSVHGNPNFLDLDTLCEAEIEFNRLNLSTTPSRHSPFAPPPPSVQDYSIVGNNSAIDSSIPMGFSPYMSDVDLQRLRVQSAVRGQMGVYMHHPPHGHGFGAPGQESLEAFALRSLNSNSVTDYQYQNQHRRNLVPGMNRYPPTTRPIMNQNGFQSNYNMGYGRGSSSNGIGGYGGSSSKAIGRGYGTSSSNGNGGYGSSSYGGSSSNGIGNGGYEGSSSNGSYRGYGGSSSNGGYGCSSSNGNGFRAETNSRGNSNNLPSSMYHNHLQQSRQQQHQTFVSLEELRGRIVLAARDQRGCRFLQKKFEARNPEEIEMIFAEVKDHVRELMVDQFGNYFIQKFFEVCTQEQITQMLLLVVSDERHLLNICGDMHGTRAMQKLLNYLITPEQRSLVISVLRRITATLTKSLNGHHVIQHCLKFFTSEEIKHLLNVVADNCLDIATDKSGCCVLQQCVLHAEGEPKERLLAEITGNALILAEHPYGNYVVQYMLGMTLPDVKADILAQLVGSYVSLSMNKYGSNVVEKCLKESGEDQASRIITEIVNSPNFLMVLQDPYGNYVAQSALTISKGALRHTMVSLIQMHYPFLHSHPHGKRVLVRTRGSKQRI